MKKYIKNFLLLSVFIILYFSACQTSKNLTSALNPVYVTNSKSIQLLSTENIECAKDSMQQIFGDFGGQSFSFLAYFHADKKALQLSLISAMGTDLGSLEYDGDTASFSSGMIFGKIKPEYIIADIQNAYYTSDSLKKNYEKSGIFFEEEISENGKIRKIISGKDVVEQITISKNNVTIENFLRGYIYRITEIEE